MAEIKHITTSKDGLSYNTILIRQFLPRSPMNITLNYGKESGASHRSFISDSRAWTPEYKIKCRKMLRRIDGCSKIP